MLSHNLQPHIQVHNLSRVCASNTQISLQVRHAVEQKADYILYLATSSTRDDVKFTCESNNTLFDRYLDQQLVSYSIHSINETTVFNETQQQFLKQYQTEFFDLDLAVYQNQCVIESTLQLLVNRSIPFMFDQGGFEHPSFESSKKNYFETYSQHRSAVNLWDFAVGVKQHRPYFHITDSHIHREIADYYTQIISHAIKTV